MRERLLKLLPRLSEQFHLSPSEFWALTQDELGAYMDAATRSDADLKAAG